MSGPLIDKFMRDAIASGCTVRVFIRGQSSSVKLEGQVEEYDGIAFVLSREGRGQTVRVDAASTFQVVADHGS